MVGANVQADVVIRAIFSRNGGGVFQLPAVKGVGGEGSNRQAGGGDMVDSLPTGQIAPVLAHRSVVGANALAPISTRPLALPVGDFAGGMLVGLTSIPFEGLGKGRKIREAVRSHRLTRYKSSMSPSKFTPPDTARTVCAPSFSSSGACTSRARPDTTTGAPAAIGPYCVPPVNLAELTPNGTTRPGVTTI